MVNAVLAELLDRQAAAAEPEALLGALVDHGLFVPVQDDGSVMFLLDEDGKPVLPGYVSEECRAELLPQAAGAVRCDVLRLLDIAENTGVAVLVPHSAHGWASVPVPLLYRTLQQRGWQAGGERLKLSWSKHPAAFALRDAVARRILEFPAIRTVWISKARWVDTGAEHLMLHVAVDEALPSESAQRLMEALLSGEVTLGPEDPKVGMIALNVDAHAASVAELEAVALDTVRLEPATGRVEVLSRRFDEPVA